MDLNQYPEPTEPLHRDNRVNTLSEQDYRAPANRAPASWAPGETGPLRDVDLTREGPLTSVSVYPQWRSKHVAPQQF